MTATAMSVRGPADQALSGAVAFWLLAALAGQWAFFYYIAAFYGVSTFSGDFEVWNRLIVFGRTPYVPGDTGGNLAYAAHALGAGLIALGGALQLIPQVRSRWPTFHRWNGRVFLTTVTALSLSGYYLVWIRGTSPSLTEAISTSINGLLILGFAYLAYKAARVRDIAVHRRWAMRLYLVSNAQWFLRIGFFGYFVVSQLIGHKPKGGDPFLSFWTFGCYLVPLVVLEFYLRAKEGKTAAPKWATAGLLVTITLAMSAGIIGFGAFSFMLASGAPIALPK